MKDNLNGIQALGLEFVDLTYNTSPYDTKELLQLFYENLMKKNFPVSDHLDDLEVFEYLLSECCTKEHIPFMPVTHVLLLVKPPAKPNEKVFVAAALSLEYYVLSNCGLLAYLVTDASYRGKKLSNFLIEKAYEILHKESIKRFNKFEEIVYSKNYTNMMVLKQMGAFLQQTDTKKLIEKLKNYSTMFVLECEDETTKDTTMDSTLRHKIYQKLGFRMLDFDYIQAPLSKKQKSSTDLLMLCYERCAQEDLNSQKSLDSEKLKAFLWEFTQACSPEFEATTEFKKMINSICSNRVPLLDLPWRRKKQANLM